MVLIFDLDDTLYDEMSFVRSGIKAVAKQGATLWGLNEVDSERQLNHILTRDGRGAIFDTWLDMAGVLTRGRVQNSVATYRQHTPSISLFKEAEAFLSNISPEVPLYLVTDGNKNVQHNKVSALGLWDRFRRVFLTHRFGLSAAKPSTHCFEIIKKTERCDWKDMVYVGDNPAKDFVGYRPLGLQTIRVLTGRYADTKAKRGYDAGVTISDIDSLADALRNRRNFSLRDTS
jgi:putative hydrolase of the HAD superfamily